MTTKEILSEIKKEIKEKNINQTHLAQKMGIGRSWLSQIFNAENPTFESTEKVCAALGRKLTIKMEHIQNE